MSPEYSPNPKSLLHLRDIFNEVGTKEGRNTFIVTLKTGEKHSVTFSENSVISSQPVIDSLTNLAQEIDFFRGKEGKPAKLPVQPYEEKLTDELTVFELFKGTSETRAARALGFMEIHTVKELLNLLNEPDCDNRILQQRNIGQKTLQNIKTRVKNLQEVPTST